MTKQAEVTDKVVHLDYAELRDTIFRNCKMVYSGGQPPALENVTITECKFVFEGPALNTSSMMALLCHTGDANLVVKGMLGLSNWGPLNGEEQ
ncbi:hypothetical protein ROLI_026560 [Roseobacter fucihabitans]|uniref:Uncharacterized protein n=1 Tax=Roseobacter fucihabitans TaxID=1537242 RepID=A0ABZ2BU51_9RHOB|nr:hypothetical protein [Roseobacter litoralis]MBC6965719.1 hypothetical protein [Roseobacter litoralis]